MRDWVPTNGLEYFDTPEGCNWVSLQCAAMALGMSMRNTRELACCPCREHSDCKDHHLRNHDMEEFKRINKASLIRELDERKLSVPKSHNNNNPFYKARRSPRMYF